MHLSTLRPPALACAAAAANPNAANAALAAAASATATAAAALGAITHAAAVSMALGREVAGRVYVCSRVVCSVEWLCMSPLSVHRIRVLFAPTIEYSIVIKFTRTRG